MTTHLLDANVLIALSVTEHVHHEVAHEWFATQQLVAVCPLVEGALVRFLVRLGEPAVAAGELLRRMRSHGRVEFWADDLSYADTDLTSVVGHRQVTDANLVQLARARHGRLATLDRGVAELYPDDTTLLGR